VQNKRGEIEFLVHLAYHNITLLVEWKMKKAGTIEKLGK
jgi:hypothetical protein